MKTTILIFAKYIACLLRLIPFAARKIFIKGLLLLESRIGPPEKSLKRLFQLYDFLDLLINERATKYGNGVHPKHVLTKYHDFFVRHISPGCNVLDIGCGVGEVARTIVKSLEDVIVTGVDVDAKKISFARSKSDSANLKFIEGDVLKDFPSGLYQIVIMSNVLEHIDQRVSFLKRVITAIKPVLILIRVPLFERHWHIAMRRELNVNYFSDPTHYIEYSILEFRQEMFAAGLVIDEMDIRWGEIWAVCKMDEKNA